ncbi:glycosyltransferase family 87 protein [Bradyrhizobium sp. HKCCYLS1011]|uniref:glycosyltransferase family 87 protein n=1 Tax=Bradyrhizobium sp. HKCCYLS1011 TaxID=3420733 RepID=UPI003EBBEB1F
MSKTSSSLRWPSLRAPVDILFLICCVLLVGDVLVPELWGHGKSKDYPLWYWAGQQVLGGADLYPQNLADYFAFLYPPFPAVLLAIPAWFGKVALYSCLALLNVVAWWMTAQLSHAMTGSGRVPNQWLYFLPGFVTISFVFDMFDLGQPNLMLLALMLYGFWLMQHARPYARPWLGGSMFALATAIKVFPVAVLPYLVWRRQWAAAVSMIVFTLVFLFVVPAPVRGFQHNVDELKTWYQGMVGGSSEKGFGQRDEQNWSWVNQSIIAVTHRLTRPVNYNQDDPSKPAATMNVVDISFKEANLVVLAVSLALGLGFLAVMPREKRRTPRSDAEELGILFCLMTVASPLARQYYFMWLFFPMTVLMHRAAYDPRPQVRLWTWLALALSGILLLLSLPPFPKDIQAWGNNLAATAVMAGALVWHILHPPLQEVAGSPRPTELKPAQQSA